MMKKIFVALLVVVCIAWNAHAADDLIRVAPKDAMVVARIQNLHALWKQFADSDAFKRLETAPISEVRRGIAQARQNIFDLEQQTGQDVELGLASIFGTDAALVMFPDKTAAFVARSEDPNRMIQAVDLIIEIERNEGKYAEEAVMYHEGVEIQSFRIKPPEAPIETARQRHHAITDNILIVSENPDAVRHVIDVIKAGASPLAEAPEYAEAMKYVSPDAVATLYVDTDQLAAAADIEGFLAGKLANPAIKLLVEHVKNVLSATRYVVTEFKTQPDGFTMDYTIAYDDDAMQKIYGDTLPTDGAPLDIVRFAPKNAVLFYANQSNKTIFWKRLLDMTQETMPTTAESIKTNADRIAQMVGNFDFEAELLSQFGEQAALIVLPGPGADDPPAVALALEMKPGATLPVSLRTMLGFAVTAAQMDAEKQEVEPTVAAERWAYLETELSTLVLKDQKFNGKLNPTMFSKDKFLVLTTTPECAQALLDAYATEEVKPSITEGRTTTGQARLNVRTVIALLEKHRNFLLGEAVKDGKTLEQANEDINRLGFLLGFFQSIDMHSTYAPGIIYRAVDFLTATPR